jgi:hypothetical protein
MSHGPIEDQPRDPTKTDLTALRLRELLDYDPDTGVFIRRVGVKGYSAGSVAGCVNKLGYVQVRIDGTMYYAHRLAYLYMTGEWPAEQIDHRDTVRTNNAWANLRAATSSQNKMNSRRRRDNSSGVKGVMFDKSRGMWRAEIEHRGRRLHLGRFSSKSDAAKARRAAEIKYHAEFARSA